MILRAVAGSGRTECRPINGTGALSIKLDAC